MADVIDLTDHTPTPGDRDLLGGKALHLAQLAAAGLPVPRAVAVPADHPEPDAAADQAHATLDAASYAVRSSSPAEDGGATSGAGRYESLLRIAPDALGRAIATVRDTDGDGPIPVIVMPFVELAAGGVAFSTDPLHGGPDRVIHAVNGHHAAVTDGLDPGIAHRVGPDGGVTVDGDRVLTDGQAERVASLTDQCAALLGTGVDMEFGVRDGDGDVVVLQARPLTSFPVWEAPPGVWIHDGAYSSSPVPQLLAPRLHALRTRLFGEGLAEAGALMTRLEHRCIGGHAYSQMSFAAAPERARGGPPPAIVMGILARLHPELRRRARAAHAFLRDDAVTRHERELVAYDWEAVAAELADLASPSRLAADAAASITRIVALLDELFELHYQWVLRVNTQRVGAAGRALERSGVTRTRSQRIVCGPLRAGTDTGRQARLMRDLARTMATDPAAVDAVRTVGAGPDADIRAAKVLARLADRPGELGRTVTELLHAARVQSMGIDVDARTLGERPAALVEVLVGLLDRGDDPQDPEADRQGAADRLLADAPAWTHDGIRAAWEQHHQRDRQGMALCAAIGAMRMAALHVGESLVSSGQLETAEQALCLTIEELVAAVVPADGTPTIPEAVAEAARERDATLRRLTRLTPPAVIGATTPPEGGPPDLRFAPRALRVVNERISWTVEAMFGGGAPSADRTPEGHVHHGVPASVGIVEGTARIVADHRDVVVLEDREILVCPYTRPVWTAVLQRCGGVVTTHGGPLSHAAIVARELGIPAVCGVGDALTAIHDGDRLRVDGEAGTVTVLDG